MLLRNDDIVEIMITMKKRDLIKKFGIHKFDFFN